MRVLSVIFALFISLGVQAADSYSIGVVTNSIGQVSWQRQDMPVQLQRGDPVSELDQVSTGKDARVILRMNDGSVITVGGSSTRLLPPGHSLKEKTITQRSLSWWRALSVLLPD